MGLKYLLTGFNDIFQVGFIRNITIVLALTSLIIIYRRLSISKKSGGKFSSSYNIKDGYLYIHSGLMPGKRKFFIKNIESVTINLVRAPRCNGDRYFISISMRVGRNTAFFVGKSKGKEVEIAELRKKLKKNCVRVYYYD